LSWVRHWKREWCGEKVGRGPKQEGGAPLQTSLTIGQEFHSLHFYFLPEPYNVSIHLFSFERRQQTLSDSSPGLGLSHGIGYSGWYGGQVESDTDFNPKVRKTSNEDTLDFLDSWSWLHGATSRIWSSSKLLTTHLNCHREVGWYLMTTTLPKKIRDKRGGQLQSNC